MFTVEKASSNVHITNSKLKQTHFKLISNSKFKHTDFK
jgi:hypothetical protein